MNVLCFFCGDPSAHPATGCQYSARVLACYRCTVEFWAWMREQYAKRARVYRDKRGRLHADFYAAAAARMGPASGYTPTGTGVRGCACVLPTST